MDDCTARLRELHEAYRADYTGYYERNATPESPAIRGADPLIILVPGVGMFSYGKDKQTARWPVSSTSTRSTSCEVPRAVDLHADRRVREVQDRILGAGGGQAAADAEAQAARHPDCAGDRSRLGHRQGHRRRLAAEGACVVIADLG